jgi:hypothetical protein
MRITQFVQGAQRVELEVFGQEKANFTDIVNEHVRGKDGRTQIKQKRVLRSG